MRYFISISIVVLSLLFVLKAQAQTTVTLWHAYRGDEKEAIKQITNNFNTANEDVQIKLLGIPYDAFADKITAAIPRGKGPDLFIFAHDRIGGWVAADVIEPIDFYLEEDISGRFVEGAYQPMVYDGSVYGLPLALKSVTLYYNPKIISKPPQTTDEMIEIAKKHTDEAAGKYGLVYEVANFYYHAAWLQGLGGSVFDKDNNPVLNSKANIQSFHFAQDLFHRHKVVPPEVSNVLVTTLFNEGKAAMVISGPWFRGEIKGVDYELALLPKLSANGQTAKPFMSSEGVLMSTKSEHKDEAFKVMNYLTSKDAALTMATIGKIPVANKEALNSPEVKKDRYIPKFIEQIKYSKPMPSIPEMTMVWSPATSAIGNVVNSGGDPTEELNKAQKKVLEVLKASGMRK